MTPIGELGRGSCTPGLFASATRVCSDVQNARCSHANRLVHLKQRLRILMPTYSQGDAVPDMWLSVYEDDAFLTGLFVLPLTPMSRGNAIASENANGSVRVRLSVLLERVSVAYNVIVDACREPASGVSNDWIDAVRAAEGAPVVRTRSTTAAFAHNEDIRHANSELVRLSLLTFIKDKAPGGTFTALGQKFGWCRQVFQRHDGIATTIVALAMHAMVKFLGVDLFFVHQDPLELTGCIAIRLEPRELLDTLITPNVKSIGVVWAAFTGSNPSALEIRIAADDGRAETFKVARAWRDSTTLDIDKRIAQKKAPFVMLGDRDVPGRCARRRLA